MKQTKDKIGVLLSPLKTIREHCFQCSNYSHNEVKQCPCTTCELYPYRFGHDPRREKKTLTERQRDNLQEQLAKNLNRLDNRREKPQTQE